MNEVDSSENDADTAKIIQGHPSKKVENEGTKNIVGAAKSVFSDQFSQTKKTIISEKIGEFKYKIFKHVNFHFGRYFLVFLCEHAKTEFSTTFFVLAVSQPRSTFFVKSHIFLESSKSKLSYT